MTRKINAFLLLIKAYTEVGRYDDAYTMIRLFMDYGFEEQDVHEELSKAYKRDHKRNVKLLNILVDGYEMYTPTKLRTLLYDGYFD